MTPADPPRPRPRHGRVWAWSFAVSALVHAVGLALLSRGPLPPPPAPAEPGRPVEVEGLRVVRWEEPERSEGVADQPRAEPTTPAPATDATERLRATTPPAPAPARSEEAPPRADLPTPEVPTPPPAASATDDPGPALAPNLTDPVLWRPRTGDPAVPDELVRERLRIEALVRAYGDSIGGLARPPDAHAFADWTRRGGSGERWGMSAGAIHLGGLTIPLCSGPFDASNCGFGVPPERRDEYREALRRWLELERQATAAEIEERAAVLRARLDSLRRARRGPGGEGQREQGPTGRPRCRPYRRTPWRGNGVANALPRRPRQRTGARDDGDGGRAAGSA